MAITDIDISEELVTNAPSIKYTGNEGPKSPQEEQMMMADALLKEEYNKYVFDLLEIRPEATPMTIEEFRQMVIAEGQMSGGQPLPQDPTKPVNPFQPKPTGPVLPDRQMAAYGGIMGIDGRRQYGLGSSLKKFVRNIIPNEVAEVAVKAAPFVAPFNPIAAGLMAGVGGFDQTGRIGSSLKSGLMTYGMGQLARGVGGGTGNLQTGFNPMGGMQGMKYGFSSPLQGEGGLSKFLDKRKAAKLAGEVDYSMSDYGKAASEIKKPTFVESIGKKISSLIPESTLGKVALGSSAVALGTALLGGGPQEVESAIMERGEGLDLDSIRLEVREAFKDETGENY